MFPERRITLTTSKLREIAVRASADPRSVTKIVNGGRVRGLADDRVRAVLAEMGLLASAESRAATDTNGPSPARPEPL